MGAGLRKLRWGLIGCGDIAAKRVAPALRDSQKCDFVAVSRAHADLAEPFAAEFGARKWYKTWEELIRDDEIEAVYIATPVYLHCAQTIAAAQAGKNVLCEKPMSLDPGRCEEMITACRMNNVKLGIAYYRHFYPVIKRIKEVLTGGEIGQAVFAQINAFEFLNPQPDESRYWFVRKEQSGGGPMFDFGCHRIEVLLNIFGTANYSSGFVSKVIFDREVEDTCTAFLSFDSGPRAIINVTHAAYEHQDTLDIFGTKGSVHVPLLNAGVMTVKTQDKERLEKHPPHRNIHQPLIEEFTEAVLGNRQPGVDGDIGKEVARIEEEIYKGWKSDK